LPDLSLIFDEQQNIIYVVVVTASLLFAQAPINRQRLTMLQQQNFKLRLLSFSPLIRSSTTIDLLLFHLDGTLYDHACGYEDKSIPIFSKRLWWNSKGASLTRF
jgi:hypothetical protein